MQYFVEGIIFGYSSRVLSNYQLHVLFDNNQSALLATVCVTVYFLHVCIYFPWKINLSCRPTLGHKEIMYKI